MSGDPGEPTTITVRDVTADHIEAGCRLAYMFLTCCRPADAADLLHGLKILAPNHEPVSRLLVFSLMQLGEDYDCHEEARFYLRNWPETEHGNAVRLMQCYAAAFTGTSNAALHVAQTAWREAC